MVSIESHTDVAVHRNLNKKCWSIVNPKTGLVIAHRKSLVLGRAQFKVSEAGRQRVLREQRKNVHARVRGEYLTEQWWYLNGYHWYQVKYDPYKRGDFYQRNGRAIKSAEKVVFGRDGTLWVGKRKRLPVIIRCQDCGQLAKVYHPSNIHIRGKLRANEAFHETKLPTRCSNKKCFLQWMHFNNKEW